MIENGGENGIGDEDKRVPHRKRMDHHISHSFRSVNESENESRLLLYLDSKDVHLG